MSHPARPPGVVITAILAGLAALATAACGAGGAAGALRRDLPGRARREAPCWRPAGPVPTTAPCWPCARSCT